MLLLLLLLLFLATTSTTVLVRTVFGTHRSLFALAIGVEEEADGAFASALADALPNASGLGGWTCYARVA